MDLTDTTRAGTLTSTATSASDPTSAPTPTLTLSELLAELGVADDEALPRFWD